MTGMVTSLRPGGFGFIASDAYGAPWKLVFRRAAVAAEGFDRLRAGQRVRFDEVPLPGNPSRRHAVRVAPLDLRRDAVGRSSTKCHDTRS